MSSSSRPRTKGGELIDTPLLDDKDIAMVPIVNINAEKLNSIRGSTVFETTKIDFGSV